MVLMYDAILTFTKMNNNNKLFIYSFQNTHAPVMSTYPSPVMQYASSSNKQL